MPTVLDGSWRTSAQEQWDVPRDQPVPPDFFDNDNNDGDGDDDNNEPSRWVTVARFSRSSDAHIARIKLEAEDIDCVIIDEHLGSTLGYIAVGGIKLQVPEAQSRVAQSLLGNTRRPHPTFCPACHQPGARLAPISPTTVLLSLLLLGIPLAFLSSKHTCPHCNHSW
jgi:hypothetical protein